MRTSGAGGLYAHGAVGPDTVVGMGVLLGRHLYSV